MAGESIQSTQKDLACINISVHIYTHTHAHAYVYRYTDTHTCTPTSIYTYIYTHEQWRASQYRAHKRNWRARLSNTGALHRPACSAPPLKEFLKSELYNYYVYIYEYRSWHIYICIGINMHEYMCICSRRATGSASSVVLSAATTRDSPKWALHLLHINMFV